MPIWYQTPGGAPGVTDGDLPDGAVAIPEAAYDALLATFEAGFPTIDSFYDTVQAQAVYDELFATAPVTALYLAKQINPDFTP